MKLQMSNTSIPERWNSTKQLKLLFVCAQRLKDCEMNITRDTTHEFYAFCRIYALLWPIGPIMGQIAQDAWIRGWGGGST